MELAQALLYSLLKTQFKLKGVLTMELNITNQLKDFGLNPKEWFVRIKNNKTAIFVHKRIDDFVLIAQMNSNLKVQDLNMMSL